MISAKPMAMIVVLAAMACASGSGPGSAGYPYNVRGSYVGRLVIEDRPFDARLQLRTEPGGRVAGSLRVVSPVEIDGSVRGRVIDDLLRITVAYTGTGGCDGRLEGILDIGTGGSRIDGPVTIFDCGDPVGARLTLSLSPGARPGAP